MPLTEDEERTEHLLRIDQMTVNIEKMRAEMRWESRRFMIQAIAGTAAAIAAGAALATLVLHLLGRI